MKIVIYCQHVLGIGHFFRTLEICRALDEHHIVLVSGGPETPAPLPPHVRRVQLPELAMDHAFQNLHARDGRDLEKTREERQALLEGLLREEAPDIFLIELYPLGRKAFRRELDPVLEKIKDGHLPSCRVVCSVRDILVEKDDKVRHETRAVKTLNRWFDAVLIHADPTVIRLDATFDRMDAIEVPVAYTGFVAPPITPLRNPAAWRERRGIGPEEILVVASAGGGAVGYPLLDAVTLAACRLPSDRPIRLQVFTGPYMAGDNAEDLMRRSSGRLHVHRFAADFQAWLQAADLSISMAGYNTCMNILAARVPALVHPFAQNREQGLRAHLLQERGLLGVLADEDLPPQKLAGRIAEQLRCPRIRECPVDLDGAAHTARWLSAGLPGQGGAS
jgi:predicted glycosyltransferase